MCAVVASLQPPDAILVDESLTSGSQYWDLSKVGEILAAFGFYVWVKFWPIWDTRMERGIETRAVFWSLFILQLFWIQISMSYHEYSSARIT